MIRWLLAAALLAPLPARAADPSALWNIIRGQCVPHEAARRDPSPCAEVDLTNGLSRGYAVLKDIVGPAQFLLLPTARISGIEDPRILLPGAVNYWDDAWRSRYFTAERLGAPQPRDGIILAINSMQGRTQNQLHIHIDCIRQDVREALARHLRQVRRVWTPFPVALAGQPYRALRIDSDGLSGVNPFHVLADADPAAAADMGEHTLAVIGEGFPDGTRGFVLLDGKADPAAGDFGSAEELQDHSCRTAARWRRS
jgi:CDP-diacylglycerol pyrophosphatase